MSLEVTLLYRDDCPHWRTVDQRLRALQPEFGFELEHVRIATAGRSAHASVRSSPTVLLDGVDPFAGDEDPAALTCRLFGDPDGLAGAPTTAQLRTVLTGR